MMKTQAKFTPYNMCFVLNQTQIKILISILYRQYNSNIILQYGFLDFVSPFFLQQIYEFILFKIVRTSLCLNERAILFLVCLMYFFHFVHLAFNFHTFDRFVVHLVSVFYLDILQERILPRNPPSSCFQLKINPTSRCEILRRQTAKIQSDEQTKIQDKQKYVHTICSFASCSRASFQSKL